MNSSKRKVYQAVLFAVSAFAASHAMAAGPNILGGGSSLVGPSIQSEISIFPTADGVLTYFTDSSGAGQSAFLSNVASDLVSVHVSGTTSTTITATGTVDWANSDAGLSGPQVTAYQTGLGATDGPLIQMPYIVTPITVPIVNGPTSATDTLSTTQTSNATGSVALNDDDLCGIFSGKLTTWNQVVNPDTGSNYNFAGQIKVIYRSDSSGTTDLLTRHLNQVCRTTAVTEVQNGVTVTLQPNSNVSFAETLTFLNNFGGTAPSTLFIGASGSGGIQSALLAIPTSGSTPGAVAYLSPDWTNTLLAPSSTSASNAQLAVASLRNTTTNTDVAPTAANALTALGTITAPAGNTAGTAAANPLNWVPDSANPATGYPVSGTSQIVVSQCYASSAVSAGVIDFLSDHYTNASYQAIVTGNGFDTLPTSYSSVMVADFISPARGSGDTLSIGNTAVCGVGGVTGR